MNHETFNLNESGSVDTHPSFEELTDYIFSDENLEDFLKTAAMINSHIMKCPQCNRTYQTLLALSDAAEGWASIEPGRDSTLSRIMKFLTETERNTSVDELLNECFRFKRWLSFSISSMKELIQTETPEFSHPKLVTVMKSSTGCNDGKPTESKIRSSLSDSKNRVSIGLDGTLSLYFDAVEHPAGQRVIILPDDPKAAPKMGELAVYDLSISYARFEDISTGKYTVVVQE